MFVRQSLNVSRYVLYVYVFLCEFECELEVGQSMCVSVSARGSLVRACACV